MNTALEELAVVLETNPGTKQYSDIFKIHLIKPIETALKALEIIKERNIDVALIKNTKNYDEYCNEFAIKVLSLQDEKFFVKK